MDSILTSDNLELAIRATLDKYSLISLTSEEIYNAINDGYITVASRVSCIESIDSLYTIPNDMSVPFSGHKVTDIYLPVSGVTLINIIPQLLGYAPIDGLYPQYWLQWGNNIILYPTPDAIYQIDVYISDFPVSFMHQKGVIFTDTTSMDFLDTESMAWNTSDRYTDISPEFYDCIFYFSLYTLSIKFKNWTLVKDFYNEYIIKLMNYKHKFITRISDARLLLTVPGGEL